MRQKILMLSIVLVLLLLIAPVNAVESHVTINTFSLTNILLPNGTRTVPVTISSPGLNLTGSHSIALAPRACQPCQHGDPPPVISRALDLVDVFVISGTIDGVYYDEVYLQGQLEILANNNAIWIPMSWVKEVKFIVPVTLTGPISAYRTSQDRNLDINALFRVANVNLRGTATVNLYWYLSQSLPPRPIYEDKLLSYDLNQPLQQSRSKEDK